jgi:hypothetical protein
MNKRLTLIVAGALAALAVTALPGTASRKATKLKCEGSGLCAFNVVGNEVRISLLGGDTGLCTQEEGHGDVTELSPERTSSTGTLELTFKECIEHNTIFHFACSNTTTSGNITPNVMTMHGIAIESGTKAGVLLTNAGFTFTCAGGFASTQVTGSYIGELETACGTNTSTVQK